MKAPLDNAYLAALLAGLLLLGVPDEGKAQHLSSPSPKASDLFRKPRLQEQQANSRTADAVLTKRPMAESISRPLTSMEYEPNGAGWTHNYTYAYTYDNMGRVTQVIVKEPGGTNTLKLTTAFDAHGNETESLVQAWGGSNWITSYGTQTAYTYNGNGLPTETIVKSWENGVWVLEDRIVYTYNSSGDILSETSYFREEAGWVLDDAMLYTYATPGGPFTSLTFQESNAAGELENDELIRDIVWHDADALLPISYLSQVWENGAWVNEDKYEATYTENNSSVGIYKEWLNGAWVNEWRDTYTYDVQQNPLLEQSEVWENGAWQMEYGYKYSYAYNTAKQITEMIEQEWDEDSNTYVNSSRMVYSDFQNITAAPDEAEKLLTAIYPNPTADRVVISYGQIGTPGMLTVTDMAGKVMHSRQLTPAVVQHEIDLSPYPAGLYFVRLQAGSGMVSRKVIKL